MLFRGSQYDDYARAAILENPADAFVWPALALWGAGSVITLSGYLTSKTIGNNCAFVLVTIAALLAGSLIYLVVLCTLPYPDSSGDWFWSVSRITADDTRNGGLWAAPFMACTALIVWIPYGLVGGRQKVRAAGQEQWSGD